MNGGDGQDFDLFVIGGGSGGVRAARVAAEYGARVALAEVDRLGGTCVLRGCIPKKLLVYAAGFADDFRDAAGFGWSIAAPHHDWAQLQSRVADEIARLSELYRKRLLDAGVTLLRGRATLGADGRVDVNGTPFRANHVVIATGARPVALGVPGQELALNSDQVFALPSLGEHVAIVGGGYIGVELASVFTGLGRRVTLLVRDDGVLRGFDDEVRAAMADGLRSRGVDLRTNTELLAIERARAGLTLRLSDGSIIGAAHALIAIGRSPATGGLGLEALGVRLSPRGAIEVDAFSRTSRPGLHAIGDCTDRAQLTPVAIAEGQALADTLFGGRPTPVDHDLIPTAVFGLPACAQVGLTEREARQSTAAIDVYAARFRPLRNTLSQRPASVLVKLVVEQGSERVLGAHMVGEEAPEIIQSLAIAVRMGARKADFDRTLALHPTTAEEFVLLRRPRP